MLCRMETSWDWMINSDVSLTWSLPKMTGVDTNASVPGVSDPGAALNDQYAVLISYSCNYTESKLFFKQATSWQPRAASDLIISVSSELSLRYPSLSARVPQQASGSSSVVSLNSAPTTPDSCYDNLNEPMRRSGLGKHGNGSRRLNSFVSGSPE
ncbi:uncharacterized protein [Triticum aestivum]|uniref:uncharacterized protein isoform X2 n=1 Tax=Triticum aestivum TaxID=4565 RepID=UPI001D026F90|nr:uncharacterized protein LOC123084923 isoform X2 [Triticum aestivum]